MTAIVQEIEETNQDNEYKEPVRLKPDHNKYENRPGTTSSGRSPYDIGDQVADNMRDLTLDEQYRLVSKIIAKEEKTTIKKTMSDLTERYSKLNLGMQRMNLGNKYRGWVKREAAKAAKEASK